MRKQYWKILVFVSAVLCLDRAQADLNTGLVANWTLNDAQCTATDSSGNNLHGVIRGNPLCTVGRIGNALYFDGVGDYVEVSHHPLFDTIETQQTFTIAAWIQIRGWSNEAFGGYFPIVDKYESQGGFGWEFFIHRASSSLNLVRHNGAISCSYTPKLDTWQHIAVTFNPTQTTFYVDGAKKCQQSTSFSLPDTAGEPLYIGYSNSGGGDEWSIGLLDEIRLYNRKLSGAEIKALYHLAIPVSGTMKSLGRYSVMCHNQTTGESITLPAQSTSGWDCEKGGLGVQPQDHVVITIDGIAQ